MYNFQLVQLIFDFLNKINNYTENIQNKSDDKNKKTANTREGHGDFVLNN